MFCEKCGKPVEADAVFCENCGHKVAQSTQPEQSAAAVPGAVPAAAPAGNVAAGLKTFVVKNKLWLIVAAVALVVVIAVVLIVSSLGKRVDMSRYLKVEATGYNGYGKLDYDFDYVTFAKRVLGDKNAGGYVEDAERDYDDYDLDDLEELMGSAAEAARRAAELEQINKAITVKCETPDGKDSSRLSNDDVVKFTLSFKEAAAKKFGVKVEPVTYEFTVSGLTEAATFDVMQYFDVAFSGIDGEGRAEIQSTKAEVKVGDVTFTIEEDSRYVSCRYANGGNSFSISLENGNALRVGDTVKLMTSVKEDAFAAQGVVLTNLTKEVKVEKLGKYVKTLGDVSKVLDTVSEKGREEVSNYIYSNWGSAVHNTWFGSFENQSVGEDMKLHKAIMTTPKDTSDSTKSQLWCVYSVTLSDSSMEAPTVYYFGVSYRNLTVDADGNLPDEDLRYNARTRGYTSFDELYNDQIVSFNLNVEQSE